MAAVVGLLLVLEAIANPTLAAAFGFDLPSAAHFGSLFDRPAGSVELLRWGALLDFGGYLAMGVVVIYVGYRLWRSNELVVGVLTASGVGATIVGATGAAVLATVGPALLEGFALAPDTSREAARVALETVGRVVAAGAWGVVAFGLWGAWLLGVGWLLRPQGAFAWAALLGGVGMLAASIRTAITGRTLGEGAGPVDALVVLSIVVLLIFFGVWLLWFMLRLWQGSSTPLAESQVSGR